ncbi:arginase family protein [Microbacterium sp. KSW-18]|uniref:Arginase family protein n=1 Tax=Microbacterium aquilitoris TaxID=3067307 RepID=A0ABU3GL97_9MICO|nr:MULTISPECIES: arginase family protein [unclassified Microbacterium]MDT3330631.1 arginase family protein [Microbacterium sp. KSW-18]
MTRFLVVPQWQGSPSSRAMRLIDGAEAIAEDLPRSAVTRVEVPAEAGEAVGTGIRRFSTLSRVRDAIGEFLQSTDEPAVIIGGDCAVAVPAIAAAAARHPSLTVVWLDAHGDLHTPDSSPSGALAGMALRAAIEPGPFAPTPPAAPARTVLVGARALDDAEADALADSPITRMTADALADTEALADAVTATGADAVYVHIDLDVLDPAAIVGLLEPVPFGADPAHVTASLARLRERMPLVGASISGFAPATRDAAVEDLGTILRLVGAVA